MRDRSTKEGAFCEHKTVSSDGTTIGYLSVGDGPSVIVVPGVLSMARDYALFASALSSHGLSVHIVERRGRGDSGLQGQDYSLDKECEDLAALQAQTGALFVVGHSYGGLVALEAARSLREFRKVAVYEPGVSIDGSMPVDWMPGYERKLAQGKRLDALVEFTLADAPPPISDMPPWLVKLMMRVVLVVLPQYRQMLGLLDQNLREWREIARLDSTQENYQEIEGELLLMYGGRSRSKAVTLVGEQLTKVVTGAKVREFPRLDHFGIERTSPREVADAVAEFLLG